MTGIDSRPFVIDACRVRAQSRKTSLNSLIAKLASKTLAKVSPYFGMKDFSLVPAFA